MFKKETNLFQTAKIEISLHESCRKSGPIYDQILNFPLKYLGFAIHRVPRQYTVKLLKNFAYQPLNSDWLYINAL